MREIGKIVKKDGKGVYTTTKGIRYDGNQLNDHYDGKKE